MKSSIVLTGGALALLFAGTPAFAADYSVGNLNDSGAGSLRQALTDANFNPGPDTVSFQAGVSGVLPVTGGALIITDAVEVTGPGSQALQLSGNGFDTVLSVFSSSGPVRVSSLGITGGGGFLGGGVFNSGTDLTLTDCAILNNHAFFGGGVENDRGTLTLRGCLVSGNGSDFFGGGVDSTGALTVVGSVFQDNVSFQGGAIAAVGAPSASVVGSVFTRNSVTGSGGAVFGSSGPVSVVNCTFAANAAPSGSDLFSGFGDMSVVNSILWGSTVPTVAANSSTVTVWSSDVQGALAGGVWSLPGVTDGGGNLDADPLFINSTAGDFRLNEGSPCIDSGDSASVPADYTVDLAGGVRLSGSAVDLGAYEVQQDLTPEKRILALQDEVRALVAAGVKLPGRGTPLIATLNVALHGVRADRKLVAIAGLSAFSLQVRALVQTQRLSLAAGTALITESQSIIAEIRE